MRASTDARRRGEGAAKGVCLFILRPTDGSQRCSICSLAREGTARNPSPSWQAEHRRSPRASLFTHSQAGGSSWPVPPLPGPAGLSLPTASQHWCRRGRSSASNLESSLQLIILYPVGHGQGDSAQGSPTRHTTAGPEAGQPLAPAGTPQPSWGFPGGAAQVAQQSEPLCHPPSSARGRGGTYPLPWKSGPAWALGWHPHASPGTRDMGGGGGNSGTRGII